MIFNLKRYFLALKRYLHWFPLALLPLAIFLLISGGRADRFTVTRVFQAPPESPVAVTTSPVDVITLHSLVLVPQDFFSEPLALAGWRRLAETDPGLADYNFHDHRVLSKALEALSLKLDDQGRLEVAYYGPDRVLGRKLVDFYMVRLLNRMRAGYYRVPEAVRAGKGFKSPEHLQISESRLHFVSHRAWWRPERATTALLVTVLPLLLLLFYIGFREFTDPSFKSGRQAARYLELPILGFIPPLDPIIKNLAEKDAATAETNPQ
jgi:hypothetical protein